MIKNIIKRNGKIEPFTPTKVNGWGQWAAKTLGSGFDWGSVVLEAVSQSPESCTSQQLQETLIKVCLNRKTWEYNRMAGRLYISLIDRLLYPHGKPTIKELHQTLFDAGMMVKLDYSDEDYAHLEKVIDHKHDLKYPHYQISQIRSKYALRNKVDKKEYETPQFVYMRMAMALGENEPKETRLKEVEAWYNHFSYNRINAPTPNYVNLGTSLNGYASCCLYTTDDTAQSLAAGDHIAYMMTCMSAGIGTHIKTRSLGDPVRSGVIQHQGKLPYYRAMVGAIGANLQNGRGGASTVFYTAFDPEVEVIQKLRHPLTPLNKKISGCHYSFGSNKTFARKVAKNESYAPFSYYSHPELFEAQYEKDQSKFDTLYSAYEKTATIKFNARDIALGALTQSYETGVHYLYFTDAINKHTPFKDKIYSSNLCFAGDTMVAVADGRNAVSIETLANESNGQNKFPVYSSRWSKHKSTWVTEIKNAVAFCTGVKQTIVLTLSDGSTMRCTEDHKLALKNGEYIEAKDSIGLQLETFFTSLGNTRKYRHINSVSNGYAKQHFMLWSHIHGKPENGYHVDHIVNEANDKIENLQLIHRDDHFKKTAVEVAGDNNAFFKIKDKIAYNRNSIRRATLENNPRYRGMSNRDLYDLAVDVYKDTKKVSQSEMIRRDPRVPKTFSKNRFGGNFKNLVKMVISGEYDSEICDVKINEYTQPHKEEPFRCDSLSVVSITSGEVVSVYDLTVEDNHNFNIITKTQDTQYVQCSGILVHNCLEIGLPTKPFKSVKDLYKTEYDEKTDGEIGLCSLAAIVVSNIESDQQYADAAYYALKMIDKCIHKSDYIFPNLEHTAKSRLSAGVGIMGLAHSMAKHNMKYDTQEGRNFIHELSETHAWHLINASLRLGKELGNAPWMYKTYWPEGWLPIDTYEKRADELVTVNNKRDWNLLRQQIIENKGIRNSVIVAHMPGESSSLASGTTNGPYPIREISIMKTNENAVNYWVAPDGTKLKNKYQSAWDVSTSNMIKIYAIMQKWTDQAISSDLFVKVIGDTKISSVQIIQDYLDMVKYGCKTRYYVNSLVSTGNDLTKLENAVEAVSEENEPGICESCSL